MMDKLANGVCLARLTPQEGGFPLRISVLVEKDMKLQTTCQSLVCQLVDAC